MNDLNILDANCVVGRHLKSGPGGACDAADLLQTMDRFGIAGALVIDSLARENHPADGNERIVGTVRENPRLLPAWAVLPPGTTDEQLPPSELLDTMRECGVRAVFLFPNQYRFNLSDWCLDDLAATLAEARVPVFVNPNEIGPGGVGVDQTDWEGIVGLCRRQPDLPVIVSEHRIRRTQRLLYRALDACPNLRVELSCYWLSRGIEYITERWGAERLVFGSSWPSMGAGTTLGNLMLAEIGEDDRRKIAGDNLRNLLGWCETSESPAPAIGQDAPIDVRSRSDFGPSSATKLLEALGSDFEIHDCHMHVGGRMSHYHLPNGTLDEFVAEMDRCRVRRGCVFSFTGVTSDEQFGNDVVAEAVAKYPDRLIGFAVLNPHRGPDGMLTELKRCEKLGLRGIKLIPHYQGYPQEGDWLDVPCRWAHERRQIILNHHWGSPAQIERLVATFTDACFITGHMTLAYADVMRRYPNLFVCTCPLLGPGACEQAVATLGADRILFGSDYQDLPIGWGLGPILYADIPPDDKKLILGGNLERILSAYSEETE